uniref:Molybdopterin synthase catalytic subunit n=1 Tax=Oryza meridionalis TaxID=40149 RepID=A0A0E0CFD4_9ORYZ
MASDELPVAAAAAEEEDLVEILEEGSGRLDIARYVDHVHDLAAGAIATFEGTTRDSFEGRRVVELRYEAYGAMARRRLAAILREARAAHSLRRLAVAHRLGTVPAGEASVFVAASAVHRADAMEACRYVIDEVKASVPIWKKEVYDDGEVWKENREFLDRTTTDGATKSSPAPAPAKGGGCCGSKVRINES